MEIADTSGAGVRLNSIAPRKELELPFSGLAYLRRFSSFCKLLDFSSSCREVSIEGERLAPEPERIEILCFHTNIRKVANPRVTIAAPHKIPIKSPEPLLSFDINAVSTFTSNTDVRAAASG